MKIYSSLVQFLGLILLAGTTMTGCGGSNASLAIIGSKPPEQYSKKMDTNITSLTSYEYTVLLTRAVNKTQIEMRNVSKLNVQVDRHTIQYSPQRRLVYKHLFALDQNRNLVRNDLSFYQTSKGKTYSAYGLTNNDHGFDEYVNLFQEKLGRAYQNELNAFSRYKVEYDKHYRERDEKKKRLQIKLEDKTNTLPKHIVENYSAYEIENSGTLYAVDAYLKGVKEQIENFKIVVRPKINITDRYSVQYDKKEFVGRYDEFPDVLIFKANEVKYRFLPDLFVMKDKNVNLEVSDGGDEITIQNRSNGIVFIDDLVGYFNEKAYGGMLTTKNSTAIKIPPGTELTFNANDWTARNYQLKSFPAKGYVELTIPKQKVDYGYFLSYRVNSTGQSINLKKSELIGTGSL